MMFLIKHSLNQLFRQEIINKKKTKLFLIHYYFRKYFEEYKRKVINKVIMKNKSYS
jgi:hypothetical protein